MPKSDKNRKKALVYDYDNLISKRMEIQKLREKNTRKTFSALPTTTIHK